MTRPRCDQSSLLGWGYLRSFYGKNLLPIGPVAILDAHRDRCTDRFAAAHTGENLGAILLNLLPPAATIPELSPMQFVIGEVDAHRHISGHARAKRQQPL